MNLFEIFEPTPYGYRTDKDDQTSAQPKQTRRTRLTLTRIKKLRTVNDVRKIEHGKYLEKVSKQYKPPAAAPGLGL